MTSDLHICIRYEERHTMQDRTGLQKQLMVVSLRQEGGQPKTWPMSPESAMVSPPPPAGSNDTARIAIKSGDSVLVLKVADGWETLAKCEVPRVQFWTWLSFSILALVTDRCVYHWNIDHGGIPEKVFVRHQRLAFSEVVGYKGDADMRWFALTGLAPQVGEDCISGLTQLYSVESKLTQCISAHAATFVKYCFDGNKEPSTALCVACRDTGSQGYGKVHVIEMGPHTVGNLAPSSHFDHIKFIEDDERYDFPVSLQMAPQCSTWIDLVWNKVPTGLEYYTRSTYAGQAGASTECMVTVTLGLLYVVTKYGQMYVCDLETGTCLFASAISTSIIFTTALNTSTQGILAVSRSGQVLAIDLKQDRLAKYVRDVAHKAIPANRLAKLTGVQQNMQLHDKCTQPTTASDINRSDSTARPLQRASPARQASVAT